MSITSLFGCAEQDLDPLIEQSREIANLLLDPTSSIEYRPANYIESAHLMSSTSIDARSKTMKRLLGFHIATVPTWGADRACMGCSVNRGPTHLFKR